jgi:hypothetical protein
MKTDRRRIDVCQALYEYEVLSRAGGGTYRPRAYGELDVDGSWSGWMVFFPTDRGRAVVATACETTQETLAAMLDWATGLSGAYLEAALERALDLHASPSLTVRIGALERMEAASAMQAMTLERAAAAAYRLAVLAARRREAAANQVCAADRHEAGE